MTEAEYQYQQNMAKLYEEQEKEKEQFLRKYYPVDPLNGSWTKAEHLDSEIIARAYHCQQEINKDSAGRFKCSHNAVQEWQSSLVGLPLIRVASSWLERRHQHFVALAEYTKAVINGDNDKATEISETADEQLSSLLLEVSEELAYWLEQTASASADEEDDQFSIF